MPTRVYRVVFAVVLAVTGVQGRAAVADIALEYAVKANFLVRLVPFVTWPPAAFAASTAPFVICIVGPDPLGPAIDAAVRGQAIEAHPIQVRRVAAAEPGCHMMFARDAAVLATPPNRAILTVCDEPADGARPMIRFVIRDRRVRFVIDSAAVQAAGLAVSSKLLGLAVPPEPGR